MVVRLGIRLGTSASGNLDWQLSLGNCRLGSSVGTFVYKRSIKNFCLIRTLAWDSLFGNFGLGAFASERLLGKLSFRTSACQLSLGYVSVGTVAWELSLRTLA